MTRCHLSPFRCKWIPFRASLETGCAPLEGKGFRDALRRSLSSHLYSGAMAAGSSPGGTHSYPQTSHFQVHPSCQGVPLGDVRIFSSPVAAMLRLVHFGQNCGDLRISLIG